MTNQIKALRQKKGWTQERLAFEASIDTSYVSRLETGKRGKGKKGGPTYSIVKRIAGALDAEPEDLFDAETLSSLVKDDDGTDQSSGRTKSAPARSAGKISEPAAIRALLRQIDGLLPKNITVLLSAIEGFQQTNARQSSRVLPDDQSETSKTRRE